MGKRFNVTGTCIPEKHYMVDISNKLDSILKLIDNEEYFIINRPRQYGKTTILYLLNRHFKSCNEYIFHKNKFWRNWGFDFSRWENIFKGIFAGVNGAGKTSIYKSIYYNENKDEKRINTDEMVAKIGSWKERAQIKVSKGGHGVPDKDIERRYYDSLNNLNNIIEICDEVNIYDNTEVLKEVIYLKKDKIIWRDKKIPNWANNILQM